MRAVYTGHEALTFTDYLDLGTGKTLHAEPGRVYDIAPASGRAAEGVPAPWFIPLGEAWDGGWAPVALTEPEPEPQPETEPQDVPGPGTEPEPPAEEDQQF